MLLDVIFPNLDPAYQTSLLLLGAGILLAIAALVAKYKDALLLALLASLVSIMCIGLSGFQYWQSQKISELRITDDAIIVYDQSIDLREIQGAYFGYASQDVMTVGKLFMDDQAPLPDSTRALFLVVGATQQALPISAANYDIDSIKSTLDKLLLSQ